MSQLPRVSLIVVNWNGRAYLEECLSSLLKLNYPDFSVTVVDNASLDGSQDFVRERFGQVELRCSAQNLGYGGGANTVLRECETDIAVVLNTDLSVPPDWLTNLVVPMIDDPAIGIAGSKMYYPGGRIIQHAGGYITRPQAWPGHYGLNEDDRGQLEAIRDVDYVIGAALAVKRRTLQEIGLFDEGYFLYYEDVDLCLRARRAGYRVVYVPRAWLTHHESATTIKGSTDYLQQFSRGRWRFVLKHFDPAEILSDSLPTERAWLMRCSPAERQVSAAVYRATLSVLPEIWLARTRDGDHAQTIAEEEQTLIAYQLQNLIEITRQVPEPASLPEGPHKMNNESIYLASKLHQLRAKQQIREQPFVSRVPVFGPLIARLRTAWNNVATTWYVRPLIDQQNRSNAATADCIEDLYSWLIEMDREHSGYARDLAEVTLQLVQLNRQLQELIQRDSAGSPGQMVLPENRPPTGSSGTASRTPGGAEHVEW
jgi:GT2 family glycosyltransferase